MFSVTLLLLAYISSKVPISYDCLTALPEFTVRGQCKPGCYLDNYELQHGSIRCRSAKRIINTSGLEKQHSKCKRNSGPSSSHLATRNEETKGTGVRQEELARGC